MQPSTSKPGWKARLLRASLRRVFRPGSRSLSFVLWLGLLGLRALLLYLSVRQRLRRWALRRALRRLQLPPPAPELPHVH